MRVRSRSRTRAPRRIAAAGGLLVALAAVAFAAAPAALAAPLLDVTPSSGVVGAGLAATATGFPEGPVTFRWDNGQLLGTVTAGPGGTASLDFSIPATATVGSHFVRACSTNKCPQGTVYADAPVTVVPSPTPTPVPPTPTPIPTAVPTPTPRPTPVPTPTPTLRPGQTPLPTAIATAPNASPSPTSPGASSSFDVSRSDSPRSTDLGSPSPTALVLPRGDVTAEPSPDPVTGPTSDDGTPVVPLAIGGLGLVVLASVFLTLRRRRPPPSAAGAAGAHGPNALPTSWDDPGAGVDAQIQLAASTPVVPTEPRAPREPLVPTAPLAMPTPERPAADLAPRQRTIVVHVTPKDPDER